MDIKSRVHIAGDPADRPPSSVHPKHSRLGSPGSPPGEWTPARSYFAMLSLVSLILGATSGRLRIDTLATPWVQPIH